MSEPDLDFQSRDIFREPFIGLMAAIAWVAYRDTLKAYEAGFFRFSVWAEGHGEIYAAQRDLWAKLQTGAIQANGLDGDQPAEVPALEWRFLQIGARGPLPECVDQVFRLDSPRVYHSVAVATSRLLELWPSAPEVVPSRRRGQGRPPLQRERVAAEMRRALIGGYDLANASEEAMAAEFNASRNVVRAAREAVLSEINSGHFRTKDN